MVSIVASLKVRSEQQIFTLKRITVEVRFLYKINDQRLATFIEQGSASIRNVRDTTLVMIKIMKNHLRVVELSVKMSRGSSSKEVVCR